MRLDEAAQLEPMVPFPAAAGEPRGVGAQDRADLARRKRGNELLEAWPVHHAARGAPQIVVDHLDRSETTPPRDVD